MNYRKSIFGAIVLIVLSVSLSTTMNHTHTGSKGESLLTLDVCHMSSTGTLNNPDVLFIHSDVCAPLILKLSGIRELSDNKIKPLLISFQKERPPEV